MCVGEGGVCTLHGGGNWATAANTTDRLGSAIDRKGKRGDRWLSCYRKLTFEFSALVY